MSGKDGSLQGILAFVTTDKNRYLGGAPLSLFAKSQTEVVEISETIAEVFLADIVELKTGDYIIVKK